MRGRWAIAWLLFFSALLNYLDRQVLSLVSPVLRRQFHMSAGTYAHLLTAFLLGYTISQLLVGRLSDRLGAGRALFIAVFWWSSAGLLAATSRTLFQLGVFLFLMGIGQAANWPTAILAIGEWFPPKTRATAVGLLNAGASTGAIIAPLLVSTLTLHYSWRTAFTVCGLVGFLWLAPWHLSYSKQIPLAAKGNGQYQQMSEIFKQRPAWGIILARFFGDSIWYFYISWLPDYLNRVHGLSLREIGAMAWTPFLAAGIGNLAGGMSSGYLIRKGSQPARARLTVMGVAAVAMPSGVAVAYCRSPTVCIALISFVVFAYGVWASNVFTLPSDTVSIGSVGTVVGASGTAAGFGGMLTTLLAGYMIDHYSYAPVLWGIGMLPIFAFACSLLAGRHSSFDAKRFIRRDLKA